MCGASLRSRMKRTTSSRSTGETWRSATATSAPTITSATAACSFRLDGSVISISIGLECLASDIVAPLSCEMTARSCDGDDWVGEALKKARRSADPSHSRGTGHPTSRGFADSVDVLARGARILVPFTHKDGAVGIKTPGLRPAAASGSVLRPSPYY